MPVMTSRDCCCASNALEFFARSTHKALCYKIQPLFERQQSEHDVMVSLATHTIEDENGATQMPGRGAAPLR